MANMSYCRFENTFRDLMDCKDALESDGFTNMSESEQEFAERLLNTCNEMVDAFESGEYAPPDDDWDEDEEIRYDPQRGDDEPMLSN